MWGSLDEFGLFMRVPASVRADAISNWFALRGSGSLGSLWQVDCPPRYVRGIGARHALCNPSSSSLF